MIRIIQWVTLWLGSTIAIIELKRIPRIVTRSNLIILLAIRTTVSEFPESWQTASKKADSPWTKQAANYGPCAATTRYTRFYFCDNLCRKQTWGNKHQHFVKIETSVEQLLHLVLDEFSPTGYILTTFFWIRSSKPSMFRD